MRMSEKWAYESPEAIELDLVFEGSFLATVYGGNVNNDKDPVGGSEEGGTGDWGWGN